MSRLNRVAVVGVGLDPEPLFDDASEHELRHLVWFLCDLLEVLCELGEIRIAPRRGRRL